MTRQSLSRFLSERRELRTFMTLPLDQIFGRERPSCAKARKLWKAPPPVNPPSHGKNPAFPPKIPESGVPIDHGAPLLRPDRFAGPSPARARLAALPACCWWWPAPTRAPKPAPPPAPAVSSRRAAAPAAAVPAMRSSTPSWPMRDHRAGPGHHGRDLRPRQAGIAPIPAIAAMNANQPEFVKPIWSYLDWRCRRGVSRTARSCWRAMATCWRGSKHQRRAEGNPGRRSGAWKPITAGSGGFNLFAALATLAYDGPRADYAKPEFFAALKLIRSSIIP